MMKTLWIAAMLVMGSQAAPAATIEMKVHGLVCGYCVQGIEKILRENPATADVFVSLEDKVVVVSTKDGRDIADADLRKAITDAGYKVVAIERTARSMNEVRAVVQAR
jgi:mercuric ion binding protein